jgi:hypothetical protein
MTAPEDIEASADYALLPRAARGDVAALRQLAISGINLFQSNNDGFALMEGLAFARLAASIGGEGEAGLLMAALGCVSDFAHEQRDQTEWADNADAELLVIASRLADAGAKGADKMLLGLSAATSPRAAFLAQELADAMPLLGGTA